MPGHFYGQPFLLVSRFSEISNKNRRSSARAVLGRVMAGMSQCAGLHAQANAPASLADLSAAGVGFVHMK
jgi:hypothetical protein